MDRTRIKSSISSDRISNLPCDIIDNILKYLPLREVVRTSILSRGWRCKWVSIPYLVFNEIFQGSLPEEYDIEPIIYQILLLHKGPIIKFILKDVDFKVYPAIGHWLHFLSNHQVEELALRYTFIAQPIPYHLFTFDHLRHLYLADVFISLPPAFKGFNRLLRLELVDVEIALAELKMLISKCPMLEYLDLEDLYCETGELEIDAPNLKSFFFYGQLFVFCFKNASHLSTMSFMTTFDEYSTFEPTESDRNLIQVLGKLSSLKSDGGFLRFLAKGAEPQNLPWYFNHLTDLSLSLIDFRYIVEVKCVLCLIRSCPNLQSLKIESSKSSKADMATTSQYLKAQQNYNIPLGRLQNVKISCASSLEPEMEFVKLLLLKATALRKLEFHCGYAAGEEARSNMLKQLVSFRRASPMARIIFRDV
ncbi:F-box/FBD/LRR-repeat protein At1g13570-like [Sesamum indicum]|uniref:F-box/FBD/LRR-repeat protein At1g13570-like n=1 Tax=Sesamum indicum TaxID=4182 RepID=A0A6I9SXL8_SESIN|nr:F-box/FBD/LRR-repeat protein At1g13570-like [Sesamum indicum]